MWKCKHCKNEIDLNSTSKKANHSRWCLDNPKRSFYVKKLENIRECITEKTKLKRNEGIKNAHKDGKYTGAAQKAIATKRKNGNLGHSEETKQIIREKALASPHRRLKKGTIKYKEILLDSSWELELAKRLDELKIKWVRPGPISWIDENCITHNYFPDFYLEEYDIFLDPKNPQTKKVQQKKLDILLTQHKNIIIIDTIEKCKNFSI